MSMKVAMGPAWQVRDSARQGLLQKLQRRIADGLENIQREAEEWHHTRISDVQHVFCILLLRNVGGRYRIQEGTYVNLTNITLVPMNIRKRIGSFFLEVNEEIESFQYSKEEGNTLFAKLLEWMASVIAQPYHGAYQDQEKKMLQTLYGVERATDPVPLE